MKNRTSSPKTQFRGSIDDGNTVPTLLREEDPELDEILHPIILPLKKLAIMVNEGSVNLAATPSDRLTAKNLKKLTQKLHEHGLHIDIAKQKTNK